MNMGNLESLLRANSLRRSVKTDDENLDSYLGEAAPVGKFGICKVRRDFKADRDGVNTWPIPETKIKKSSGSSSSSR
jgi:hypothetical protein